MTTIIRQATPKDMPQVLELIQELADFEKETDAVEITTDDLLKDGFSDNPEFTCFVAETNNSILGMALVYKRYSTWKGVVLHLEDLIVKQEFRGKGIGSKLLNQVVIYGNQLNVKRISWEVLDWNTNAIAFYKTKGAKILKGWQVVQLNEQAISHYISKL